MWEVWGGAAKFLNAQRGYSRVTVTEDAWRNDFRVVPYVLEEGAPISSRASFTVQGGTPGVLQD